MEPSCGRESQVLEDIREKAWICISDVEGRWRDRQRRGHGEADDNTIDLIRLHCGDLRVTSVDTMSFCARTCQFRSFVRGSLGFWGSGVDDAYYFVTRLAQVSRLYTRSKSTHSFIHPSIQELECKEIEKAPLLPMKDYVSDLGTPCNPSIFPANPNSTLTTPPGDQCGDTYHPTTKTKTEHTIADREREGLGMRD